MGHDHTTARATGSVSDMKHAISMVSSYKESLMQNSTIIPSEFEEIIEKGDIIIGEGEVMRREADGVISIDFSEQVLSLAEKSSEQTVVVKLLRHPIGYTSLRNKIYELRKPSQPIKLMDIENDYFLVSF
ncbi:hypothetical protein V6N11_001183 [Hibiscus sabdariffa]|uniref:Uncharacterized protein n=1 Tax=Hibiscus sabdariffa TaxID=183260 RepID=A0ABR2RZQ7_9ROSI